MLSACSYVYADKCTACVQNVRLPNACMHRNGIVIQWYVAPYTDNTEWYVALMLAAGVWGGVGGG